MREDDESDLGGGPSGLRDRVEDLLKSALRKTVSQGVGAALHTEDLIRQRVTDMRLPKEVASYLITTVDNTRRELVRVSADEIRRFLERANLAEELARIMTTLSLDIRIQMKFIPNDKAIRPSVSSSVRVHNVGEDGGFDDIPDSDELPKGDDPVIDAAVREVGQEVIQRIWRGLSALSPVSGSDSSGERSAAKETELKSQTAAEQTAAPKEPAAAKPAPAAAAAKPKKSAASAKKAASPKATSAKSGAAKPKKAAAPKKTTKSAASAAKSAGSSAAKTSGAKAKGGSKD